MELECAHSTLRSLGDGHCVLCQGPKPIVLTYEQELELLHEEELAAQRELEALDAAAMRLSLAEFVQGAWHVLESMDLEWNWDHDAVCENLQALAMEWLRYKHSPRKRHQDPKTGKWITTGRRDAMRWQKLIINKCPGTLKSRIGMVFFVAWVWLQDPTFKFACLSTNPTNVIRDSEDCRQLVTSAWYRQIFNIKWDIHEDIDNKTKYQLTVGGERLSKGLLAKHVGIHADGVLVDDPDDAMDVHSQAERKRRTGKMESLMSRVNDKRHCFFVVFQQRVHVDDCTGELLSRGGWLHANYALEYSDKTRHDTPFYKDPRTIFGDVLQPERFTQEVIDALKLELGKFGYEAQCNGNPHSMEGGMFPVYNFRFCLIEGQQRGPAQRPSGCYEGAAKVIERDDQTHWLKVDWLAISVDATFGSLDEATASAVAIGVWAGKGPDRYRLDDRTKPRDYVQTKQAIRETIADWAPYFSSLAVLVEKKANGEAVINELTLEFSGLIGLDVDGGKETRAYACTPDVDSGHVFVLDGAHWMPDYLGEVTAFPHGKRDDRVDDTSQCIAYYRQPTAEMQLLAKNAAFKQLAAARISIMQRMAR